MHCYSALSLNQRWANSVLMTEYEYEYYSTFKKWPNTNTNIIRFEKIDRIRIRILFDLKNRPNTNTNIIRFGKITRIRIRILVFGLNYSNNIRIPNYLLTTVTHGVHHDIVHGVPHTNIIQFEKIDRIRIWFGLKISSEYKYKYYSVWKNHLNTNTSIWPQLFE